jgi:hypothetical protein
MISCPEKVIESGNEEIGVLEIEQQPQVENDAGQQQ